MTQSIFQHAARRPATPLTPARAREASQQVPCRKPSWTSSCDVALLALLEAPLRAGETAAAGFARKELELRHVLATLSVLESRALQSRLESPKAGDALAQAFQRLTGERRARLINFISDARRRATLASR
jgi:hypothetical protein